MAILEDILLTPESKPHVIDDCLTLIDEEVKGKSGISGTARQARLQDRQHVCLRLPARHGRAPGPGHDHRAGAVLGGLHRLRAGDFGDYLVKHGDEVSEALLSVTDRRAETSTRPTILKAYKTVRGGASKHVTAALPALGALVQKYAG